MLNDLDEKIFDKKFINFLVEKRIHPSHLLKLAQQIDSGNILKENIFSGIGGALKGLYHGFRAGYGSEDVNQAGDVLIDQLDFAYRTFANSIENATGSKSQAQSVLTKLRNNTEPLLKTSITDQDIKLTAEKKAEIEAREAEIKMSPKRTRTTTTRSPKSSTSLADLWNKISSKPKPVEPKVEPTAPTPPIGGLGTTGDGARPDPEVGDIGPSLRVGPDPRPEEQIFGIVGKNFLKNFNNFYHEFFDEMNKSEYFGNEENKPPFSTLKTIKRLYTYREGRDDLPFTKKNIRHLGKDAWSEILTYAIEALKANNCNFSDESFCDDIIASLKELSENGYYANILNDLKRSNLNWVRLLKALTQISKYIDTFCTRHPEKCEEEGKKGGEKLLKKLRESKNITFSDWLLISENKLF
jgi:hypothetical protein